MFQDLRSVFDRENIAGDGTFTLITETDVVDSSFVVNQLLAKHLGAGRSVCLLANTRSFHHYLQVGTKLGVNLRTYQEKGQLAVIESLKKENENVKKSSIDGSSTDQEMEGSNELQKVFGEIKEVVEKFKTENRRFSIVIDDISVWISVGIPLQDVATFFQYCRTLVHRDEPQLGALVVVTCLDSFNEDFDLNRLANLLNHLADLKISVAALTTGYSKDVHGELTLTWYNRKLRKDTLVYGGSFTRLHFKIEEKRVLTFPVGTSSAVL